MMEFSPQVKEALKENRIGQFVHIDLLFFPMRVHGGSGTVKWKGSKWVGLGDSLQISDLSSPTISASHSRRGMGDVTVPMDRKLGEALIHGYYVGRDLSVNICALDDSGGVLERVGVYDFEIVKCSTCDSTDLTFHGEYTKLDGSSDPLRHPKHDKDSTHKAGVRGRFRQNVLGVVQSQFRGDAASALVALVPFASPIIDFAVNSSSSLWRLFRLIRQRWCARKRIYTVKADATISHFWGAWRRPLRVRLRADNEKDAVIQFHEYCKKRIWRIPRGFINLPFRINGKMSVTMINLDHYRKQDNPQRWAETDPVRSWANTESDDQAARPEV